MQQIKCITFFKFNSYLQPTNLSLLSDMITLMLITTEWLILIKKSGWLSLKKKFQKADCSKSNPRGDKLNMWHWYYLNIEDCQVHISAETKLQQFHQNGQKEKLWKRYNFWLKTSTENRYYSSLSSLNLLLNCTMQIIFLFLQIRTCHLFFKTGPTVQSTVLVYTGIWK